MGSGNSIDMFPSLARVPSGYEQEWKRLGVEAKQSSDAPKKCKMIPASFPSGWSVVYDAKDMRHATYHDKDARVRVAAFFDSSAGKSQCRFLSDDEIKTYSNTERGRSHSCASLKEPLPFKLRKTTSDQLDNGTHRRRESSLDTNLDIVRPTRKFGIPPRNVQHRYQCASDASTFQDKRTTIDQASFTNVSFTSAS